MYDYHHHTTPHRVVRSSLKTRQGPLNKQEKHYKEPPAHHSLRRKRRPTFIMGILRTQQELLGLTSFPTRKQTIGMGWRLASFRWLHSPLAPLNTPRTPTSPPQRPHTNTYSPSNSHPSPLPLYPIPPSQPPPTPHQSNRNEWNYNPDGVRRKRIDYFGILQLNNNATKREIKVQYRQLARIYHPDKYDGSTNPTTKIES